MVIAAAVAGVMAIMPVSAKTVVGNMLPEEEWSSESTMTPVKVADGWKLKSSPTQDGGNAVNYFNMTYHPGQMIAYDFTAEGDEITINIGFIRDLEEDVYPNGNREFLFTKYLRNPWHRGTGEMGATLPGGTYKGVLDPGDFFYDGFDKFQHIAVYLGGDSVTIREFAFVEGAQAGAETYPTKQEETTAPPHRRIRPVLRIRRNRTVHRRRPREPRWRPAGPRTAAGRIPPTPRIRKAGRLAIR